MQSDERGNLPSASSFHRVVACPGSVVAEDAVGEVGKTSEVAQFGTDVAKAIAESDLSDLGIKQEDVAAKLDNMNKQALEDWKKDFGVDECQIFQEVRFWVKSNGKNITSARVDYAAVSEDGKFCLVVDDKSGFKEVVRASANWQLKVGLVAMDGQFTLGFEKGRVAIAQHRLGSRFDACDYDRNDIQQARNEVLFFAKRAQNPNAERVPGPHCEYCRAKTQCQEHILFAMMPMLRAKMPLENPKKADVIAKVSLLPLEALAYIESRRTVATNLFAAVTERLKGLPDDVLAGLGYELKPSGQTRSIPDLGALWAILERNNLCTPEEFRAMCKIGIGTLEEKLVPRIRLMQELDNNKAAEMVLEKLIEPVVKTEEKAKQLRAVK